MARSRVASAFGGFNAVSGSDEKGAVEPNPAVHQGIVVPSSKKVSWPTRLQVRNLTVLVFAVSFVVGLYITIADTFYTELVKVLAGLA